MKPILLLILLFIPFSAFGQVLDTKFVKLPADFGSAVVTVIKQVDSNGYKFLYSCYQPDPGKENQKIGGILCLGGTGENKDLVLSSFDVKTDKHYNLISVEFQIAAIKDQPNSRVYLSKDEIESATGFKSDIVKAAEEFVNHLERIGNDLKPEAVYNNIRKVLRTQLEGKNAVK